MTIECIVASARNGVIGHQDDIPWHLPDDFRHFKRTTMGHALVMGRKTFESIGRPLPGRRNIVVTRNAAYSADGVEVVHSLHEAFARAREHAPEGFQPSEPAERCFVIGGATLYEPAMALADVLHWTRVEADPKGDAFFPAPDPAQWVCAERVEHPADDRHRYAFAIERWTPKPVQLDPLGSYAASAPDQE
jgi:dihydrofolate reductase